MARQRRRLKGPVGPTGPVVVGLETGGDHLGVALWRLPEAVGESSAKWRLLEAATSHRGHRHAPTLLLLLDEMLTRQELTSADIALVGVGRGPGGFTGVRVGMATAVGIGIGAGALVWPVDSLAALVRNAAGSASVAVPLFDARKAEVYGGAYRVAAGGVPEPLMAPTVGPHADVLAAARDAAGDSPLTVFGSGALAFDCASDVPATWHVPTASATAWLAAMAWEAAARDAAAVPPVDPAYVRKSDAELSLGPPAD